MRHFKDGTRFYRGYDHDNYRNILGMIRNSGRRVGRPFETMPHIVLYVVDGDSWIANFRGHYIDHFGKSSKGEAWRRKAQEINWRRKDERAAAKVNEPAAFALRNDPPRPKRATFHGQERTLQRVLIDGLDCLPGQQDLF